MKTSMSGIIYFRDVKSQDQVTYAWFVKYLIIMADYKMDTMK